MDDAAGMAALDRSGGNLASSARRLAAAGIDFALVILLLYVFFAVVLEPSGMWDGDSVLSGFIAVAAAYYAGQTWLLGATPGKALLGLEIVRPDGNWPGLGRSVLRFAVWLILPVVSWAFVAGRQRQGIHDLIADTHVVRSGTGG